MSIGSTTQLESPKTNALYKIGDLFVATIYGMKDSGVCTDYSWSTLFETWMYQIKWTKANMRGCYPEGEIEISLAGGTWQRHGRKENKL